MDDIPTSAAPAPDATCAAGQADAQIPTSTEAQAAAPAVPQTEVDGPAPAGTALAVEPADQAPTPEPARLSPRAMAPWPAFDPVTGRYAARSGPRTRRSTGGADQEDALWPRLAALLAVYRALTTRQLHTLLRLTAPREAPPHDPSRIVDADLAGAFFARLQEYARHGYLELLPDVSPQMYPDGVPAGLTDRARLPWTLGKRGRRSVHATLPALHPAADPYRRNGATDLAHDVLCNEVLLSLAQAAPTRAAAPGGALPLRGTDELVILDHSASPPMQVCHPDGAWQQGDQWWLVELENQRYATRAALREKVQRYEQLAVPRSPHREAVRAVWPAPDAVAVLFVFRSPSAVGLLREVLLAKVRRARYAAITLADALSAAPLEHIQHLAPPGADAAVAPGSPGRDG